MSAVAFTWTSDGKESTLDDSGELENKVLLVPARRRIQIRLELPPSSTECFENDEDELNGSELLSATASGILCGFRDSLELLVSSFLPWLTIQMNRPAVITLFRHCLLLDAKCPKPFDGGCELQSQSFRQACSRD